MNRPLRPVRPLRPLRAALAALSVAVLASTAVACGGDDGDVTAGNADTPARPVTLVLDYTPNTNHSGFYIAQAEGWYRDVGLDVTIIEPGENGALPQLSTGNADFAVSVAEQLLPARAQGVPAVSVGTIIQHNTSSLVVPADRGVTRPAQLEGKTYGGFGGELEQELLNELILCDGGDPSKVNFVEIGDVDYKVGLDRGDYDAVWIFDAWDGIRLGELEGMALTTFPFYDGAGDRSCIPDWYTPLVSTTEAHIANDPDMVRAFMEATARGFEQARTDPDAAARHLLGAAPELDAELVERSAAYLSTRYAEDGRAWGLQDAAVWSRFASFLNGAGLIDADIDIDAAFTNAFLPGGETDGEEGGTEEEEEEAPPPTAAS